MNKLHIIEVNSYLAAINESEVKTNLCIRYIDNIPYLMQYDKSLTTEQYNIVGHYPLNKSNIWRGIPLLPKTEFSCFINEDYADMFYTLLKQTYPDFDDWVQAKEYLKFKSENNTYSEKDVKRAFDMNIGNRENDFEQFKYNLKRYIYPKWFVTDNSTTTNDLNQVVLVGEYVYKT